MIRLFVQIIIMIRSLIGHVHFSASYNYALIKINCRWLFKLAANNKLAALQLHYPLTLPTKFHNNEVQVLF